MSDRLLKLLLVERDPIFRTGLRVVIEQFPDLQVVAETETLAELFSTAADANGALDLVVLGLDLSRQQNWKLGLQMCRRLKSQYPHLPILLLTSLLEPTQLSAAMDVGVNGYCPKGTPVSDVVAAIRQVAEGVGEDGALRRWGDRERKFFTPGVFTKLRHHLRASGLQQIDATLAEVTAQLKVPGLPLLDQAVLAGHRRELIAARWLVNQLLGRGQGAGGWGQGLGVLLPERTKALPLVAQTQTSAQEGFRAQSTLFKYTVAKLQFSLENLTGIPLEIDIFREEKKRELLYLILQKIENVLAELRFSQVQLSQLPEIRSAIIQDLWQTAIKDFFGKYSVLQVGDRYLKIVDLLLQDAPVVQIAILDKIPLVTELFTYLLFEMPLVVDSVSYQANTPEAAQRAESILQNLLIQLANGVSQPLLNKLADVEAIKQNFYDQRLISTREIERFRNSLSWKYRLSNYITEPKAIFESRYDLFTFASRGIAKISIYAPRNQELAELSGIRLAVTLALETRDAIAPRLRAAVAFLGNGFVYLLTQVIGRAIGLIGRGILQGIGGSSNK